MRENYVSVSCAEGHSPNVDDLCEAMFIEGARMLGIPYNAPLSVEDQEKILLAACSLGNRLALLLEIGNAIECEQTLGN
jgi:hypothetical protein